MRASRFRASRASRAFRASRASRASREARARRAAHVRLLATLAALLPACQAAPEGASDAPPAAANTDAPAVQAPADTAPLPAAADGTTPLTSAGWGPLRIGMTRDEVVAALGEDANPDAVGGPEPDVCDEFRPVRAPAGMIVMVERNRLSRITLVRGSEVVTDAGLGVGEPASAVEAAYGGRAARSPHKYVDAPAAYLTVWDAAPDSPEPRGIVYEVGLDGTVSRVHAGGPAIRYVEGCL